MRYVTSVRKQRPDPPSQPVKRNSIHVNNNENVISEEGVFDDADVMCRFLPSQSTDTSYRLGGGHVNQSNASAHANGTCCCAHERRYMLGAVEKVRAELDFVQTSMAKGIW